jgi:hypothetical protein
MARSAPFPTLLSLSLPAVLRRQWRNDLVFNDWKEYKNGNALVVLASKAPSLTETVHSSDYFVRYHSKIF